MTDIDTLLAAADELTDLRRHVEVPEHQCLTCPQLHQHKPRIYARAQVCDRCRLHLADMLTAVPDLYHRLPEHLERGTSVWERVSGGDTEAPLPFVEDVWDLLLPYRAKLTGEDQVGYLSVITVVTTWTRDWATHRAKRELGAVVTVTGHVRWPTGSTGPATTIPPWTSSPPSSAPSPGPCAATSAPKRPDPSPASASHADGATGSPSPGSPTAPATSNAKTRPAGPSTDPTSTPDGSDCSPPH
jgi:hypothetical protein